MGDTLNWQAIVLSLAAIITAIGAITQGPLKWLDKRRIEDRDFVAGEVQDIRAKLDNEVCDLEASVQHIKDNVKTISQGMTAKFDAHSADIIRLTENQKQTNTTVSEIKAEMKAGFAEIKHDREKSDATFLAMLKSESERSREAVTLTSAAQSASISALIESVREIRASQKN